MNSGIRMVATSVIWIAIALVLIFTGIFGDNTGSNIPITAILVGGATFSTFSIWAGANSEEKNAKAINASNASSKAKRDSRDRLARLTEQMTEEEIAELNDILEENRIRR
jgi:hypothetical protein